MCSGCSEVAVGRQGAQGDGASCGTPRCRAGSTEDPGVACDNADLSKKEHQGTRLLVCVNACERCVKHDYGSFAVMRSDIRARKDKPLCVCVYVGLSHGYKQIVREEGRGTKQASMTPKFMTARSECSSKVRPRQHSVDSTTTDPPRRRFGKQKKRLERGCLAAGCAHTAARLPSLKRKWKRRFRQMFQKWKKMRMLI